MKKVAVSLCVSGLGLILATGCAMKNIKSDYVASSSNETGVIIGSLTSPYVSRPKGPCVSLYFEHHGSMPAIESCEGSVNIESVEYRGNLFALEVPAGLHQFDHWSLYNRESSRIWPAEKPPPLEVTVKPGEVVYVGNIHFHISIRKNWFGRRFSSDPIPEVRDESDRDLPLLKALYPGLSKQEINVRLFPLGVWGTTETEAVGPTIIIFH